MAGNHRTVLVTGATAKQGGAVVRHMLPLEWNVRALTRDPSSREARALADKGVEVVQGNLEVPSSFEAALRGVYGVYSVQDFWSVGAKREVVQGRNLADAARMAGVEHSVYSSVGGADRNTGIDHWESKWEIEKHIRKLGLPSTILRPVAFMEGYYSEPVEIGILQGTLMYPIRADKPYQTIATDDIGAFVAPAFERPRDFIGLELEIAGSELTNPEAAEVFSRAFSASLWSSKSSQFRKTRNGIRCSVGSMMRDFGPISPNCAAVTPRSFSTPLRTGCTKRVGTSASDASRLQRTELNSQRISMQKLQLHDDNYLRVMWDNDTRVISIDWKEATSSMSDADFKSELEEFADLVERKKAQGILVEVAHFRHKMGPEVQEWRINNISPRYTAAGVRRFAFVLRGGTPIPPMMNQSAPGEGFLTQAFHGTEEAMAWLTEAAKSSSSVS